MHLQRIENTLTKIQRSTVMLRKTKLGRHVRYFWVDIEKKCICFDIAVKKFRIFIFLTCQI